MQSIKDARAEIPVHEVYVPRGAWEHALHIFLILNILR